MTIFIAGDTLHVVVGALLLSLLLLPSSFLVVLDVVVVVVASAKDLAINSNRASLLEWHRCLTMSILTFWRMLPGCVSPAPTVHDDDVAVDDDACWLLSNKSCFQHSIASISDWTGSNDGMSSSAFVFAASLVDVVDEDDDAPTLRLILLLDLVGVVVVGVIFTRNSPKALEILAARIE